MTAGQLAIQVDRPIGPPIKPRDYQRIAVDAVLAAEQRGVRRTVIHAACGLGKTICACDLIHRRDTRALFLADLDVLVGQAVDRIRSYWPEADIGVVQAEREESAAQVVVASIQTLSRRERLFRFPRDFGLVIADECHGAVADMWIRVLKYLGCFRDDGPLLVGLTATPNRADGQGLNRVFQEIVASYPLLWGIQHRYLSDLRAREVQLDLDLDGVKVKAGDYDDGALGKVMVAADAPHHLAEAWRQHGEGRKTLAFLPTVGLARDTALAFEAIGVPAAFVYGDTSKSERRRIEKDFAAGRIMVLTNSSVYGKGYDEPSIECVIPKPTKSKLLFEQMIGRATRKHPGKTDGLILDVAGTAGQHDLCTVPTLFGLPAKALRKLSVAEAAALKELDKLNGDPARTGPGLNEDPKGTLVARDVDLFPTRLAWTPADGGRFVLPVRHGAVVLQPDQDSTWVVLEVRDRQAHPLREGITLELAQGVGEDRVRELGAGLAHRLAYWRKQSATSGQRGKVRRLGFPVPDNMTAGEASDLILAADIAEVLR